jgi:hypothetical protein
MTLDSSINVRCQCSSEYKQCLEQRQRRNQKIQSRDFAEGQQSEAKAGAVQRIFALCRYLAEIFFCVSSSLAILLLVPQQSQKISDLHGLIHHFFVFEIYDVPLSSLSL